MAVCPFSQAILPLSLHEILLREQAKIQLAEGRKISLERVIYRIIREKNRVSGESGIAEPEPEPKPKKRRRT